MLKNVSTLFSSIVDDLRHKGYSIQKDAIDRQVAIALFQQVSDNTSAKLSQAGVGRNGLHTIDTKIRGDYIQWIDASTPAGESWLAWTDELRTSINRSLFIGLEEFESHFAHYPKGAFYQRHKDAFVGESNRVLSLVTYLNPDWQSTDGGELVLYRHQEDTEGIKVQPMIGTLVLFLSEEFPHEVLASTRDRYSIAGWFRQKSKLI